ncbi:hypothetical protein [Caulobacter sp. S45]|uniref:hypothetical protein n=1 Tax=Caulobacter sp. S45 TaxID=1641861 RepID=UPI00131B0675|nr:hypothetical protein [Caulobacter sp. S45]
MRKLFIMLKRLPVIAFATSIMFTPLVAKAQSLDQYRQLAKVPLEKAHLKVVGPQTSSANIARAASIEAGVTGAGSYRVEEIFKMEVQLANGAKASAAKDALRAKFKAKFEAKK